MARIDLDISIKVRENREGVATITIEMADWGDPRVPFDILDNLERSLHGDISRAILGRPGDDAVVVKPFQRGLQGNYVACYNKLLREPSR